MVEYAFQLDNIFQSLADSTRRDILKRVAKKALSVRQIAKTYDITYAAISKHLMVLQKAKLITKHRQGKQQIVSASPAAIHSAADYLQNYEAMWNRRFDNIEQLLIRQKAGKAK